MPKYWVRAKRTEVRYLSVQIEAKTPQAARRSFFRAYNKWARLFEWAESTRNRPIITEVSETLEEKE